MLVIKKHNDTLRFSLPCLTWKLWFSTFKFWYVEYHNVFVFFYSMSPYGFLLPCLENIIFGSTHQASTPPPTCSAATPHLHRATQSSVNGCSAATPQLHRATRSFKVSFVHGCLSLLAVRASRSLYGPYISAIGGHCFFWLTSFFSFFSLDVGALWPPS